jgi:hypothetical protein
MQIENELNKQSRIRRLIQNIIQARGIETNFRRYTNANFQWRQILGAGL